MSDFNTTFVHVELRVIGLQEVMIQEFQYNICTCGAQYQTKSSCEWRISIQHLYMWSSLNNCQQNQELKISIQHLYMWSKDSLPLSNLHLDFNTTFVHVEHKRTQHIIKICFYFNTTFVHVERASPNCFHLSISWFQYNICTCGANKTWVTSYHIWFQYNICTCGALTFRLQLPKHFHFNTTFVHVELTLLGLTYLYVYNFNTTFVHVEPK